MTKYLLGAHLPISKGIQTIPKQMKLLKLDTCALFLKSQRTYSYKKLSKIEIVKLQDIFKNLNPLLPHGSYLINLANKDTILEKSLDILIDDLERCNILNIPIYNMHPGSDVLGLKSEVFKHIGEQINIAHSKVPTVRILLENMAGQGKCVGKTFEQLKQIIDNVQDKDRIGVCLDTCHLFGAGYDIRTQFEDVINEFDTKVGLKYLFGCHLNDSKCTLGSFKDRHESIGKGELGLAPFKFMMNSHVFKNMPLILETPNPALYAEEIAMLREMTE